MHSYWKSFSVLFSNSAKADSAQETLYKETRWSGVGKSNNTSKLRMDQNRIVLEEELKNTKEWLDESLENLKKGSRNGTIPLQSSVAQTGNNFDKFRETKVLKEEIGILKNEVRSAMEAEDKSKRAMDGLASASLSRGRALILGKVDDSRAISNTRDELVVVGESLIEEVVRSLLYFHPIV
ncbi:hypothetical protein Tco_1082502 [Tanacetum coccineum]|uniref:Uncharacterized protein n=1 Tax=Tanacetum coccineum TaxID=301880 RepID=A0ABQ5I2A0_9ASTR